MRTPLRIEISYVIGFVFLIVVGNGCKPMKFDKTYNHLSNDSSHYNKKDNFDSTQIIFWIKDNKKKDAFQEFQKKFEKQLNPTHKFACGNCNEDVIIYQGNDIPEYFKDPTVVVGQTGGSSGSGGTTTKAHGDDTIYWCANFKMNFNDSNYGTTNNLIIIPKPNKTDSVKTVAVLDTGVDTTGIPNDYFYASDHESCIGQGANNGWNFINNTDNWKDDNNDYMHGTMVTRFIINEVNAYGKTGVRILPVKTHNQDGEGDLFGILCAISYAADRKVDIVNASFGFYKPKLKDGITDSAVFFLKEYINYYLTANHILLVAAAGNVVPDFTQRDLNVISFYPASLSNQLENVIAVTTVDTLSGTVDPGQNYSDTIVNIGVNADSLVTDTANYNQQRNNIGYLFKNPRIVGTMVRGSSFATPIATGNLCAHYDIYQSLLNTSSFTKAQLLNDMSTSGLIKRTSTRLNQFIAGNNAMLKTGRP